MACCYCIPHKTTHPSWACFCFAFSWEPLHKMANDLCIYRARVGCFYNRAVNNHDKVVFSKLSVISFYILCCMRNHNRVTIALFFFLFAEQTPAVENTGHSTSRCFHSEPQENRLQLSSLSSSLLQLLLLRSGDIESNPGPTPNYEIKIIHLNARIYLNTYRTLKPNAINMILLHVLRRG